MESPEQLTTEIVEDESLEEAEEKIERDPHLASLWKKFHFMGDPPVKGSPVEARLIDTCARYVRYIAEPDTMYANASKQVDSENYFAKNKPIFIKSDSSRRTLHNQIALMVDGRQRSGMSDKRALEIADFACQLVLGQSLSELGASSA